MEDKMTGCGMGCASCASSCDTDGMGERKPGIFERMEKFAESMEDVNMDELVAALAKMTEELEAEEAGD